MIVERFAPSPTGLLHLGHAFSAIIAHDHARKNDGQFLLRIEDIDTARSKPEFEQSIYDDLAWLGLSWDGPVMRQSERLAEYKTTLATLTARGLTYACTCTRSDIKAAMSAPQEGDKIGFDGPVYPGTCRSQKHDEDGAAIRLNMEKVVQSVSDLSALTWFDGVKHILTERYLLETVGDIVLARKDIGTSYHIAVVVDDAAQGITDVTRGEDMRPAAPIHRLLQALLGLPTPRYHHHRLIRDENGKRLAKRHDSKSIAKYRTEGLTPNEVRALIDL